MSILANSPLLVNNINPEVFISNLPTETHLPECSLGRLSKTVGLFSGSFLVETSPTFLLYIKILVSIWPLRLRTIFFPSILKESFSDTSWPIFATSPLTSTLFCLINCSIPLLEPWPWSARTLWILCFTVLLT